MGSLWHKPVANITFSDVEEFCQQAFSEGPRLDYKRAIDDSLNKSVCAFANTLGGLIIFGVDADKVSNQPKWPPIGISRAQWSADRITQICTDGIYPPVLPTISEALDNPHAPGTVVAVMRVDQSATSPHAIDQGTKVLVRVNDIGKRFDFAEVDRIAHYLKRRDQFVAAREQAIENNIERMRRMYREYRHDDPMVWVAIGPEYPWRNICTPTCCLNFANEFELQRGPHGALGGYREKTENHQPILSTMVSVDATGSVFRAIISHKDQNNFRLDLSPIIYRSNELIRHAQAFYGRDDVEYPGLLRVSMGVADAARHRMRYAEMESKEFPDNEFATHQVIRYEELEELVLDTTGAYPLFLVNVLVNLAHAYGFRLQLPNVATTREASS